MGNFGGHALPGSFFILFSLWWTWQIFRRYYRSKEANKPFQSSVTFIPDFLPCCSNFQLEGFLKVFFTLIGLSGEIYTAFKDGHFTHMGNGQHATMFFFFGLSGGVDILMHYGAPLPENSDYAISILSFIVEDVLFMFHLHGRTQLDIVIHTLLLYVVHCCVCISIVELICKSSVVVTLTRAFLVLLQGTWFWQVGFILYKPITPWHEDDHGEIMLATMMFTWHAAIDFILIMIIGLIVKISMPFCCLDDKYRLKDGRGNRILNHKTYNQLMIEEQNEEEIGSESEVEFLSSKT